MKKEPETTRDNIITSKELQRQINEERIRQGLESMPEINSACCVSTGNLARKNKSFSSAPDFYIKLFTRNKKAKDR